MKHWLFLKFEVADLFSFLLISVVYQNQEYNAHGNFSYLGFDYQLLKIFKVI